MRGGLPFWCALTCLAVAPAPAQAGFGSLIRGVATAPMALFGSVLGARHHGAIAHHPPRSASLPAPGDNANEGPGPEFWTSAYADTFGQVLAAPGYGDAFWTHGYGDVYAALFWPGDRSGKAQSAVQTACTDAQTAPQSQLDRMVDALQPTDAQRAKLDALRSALDRASDRVRASCPGDASLGPGGRLTALWDRLRALHQAVAIVRSPLKNFYESLSDEQKTRLGTLASQPPEAGGSQNSATLTADRLTQMCRQSASLARSWPAKEIERAIRPAGEQRKITMVWAGTTSHLAEALMASCPTRDAQTPVDRLAAVDARLDALIYAVTIERGAFNSFYSSLSADQKTRFDAGPASPPREGARRSDAREALAGSPR